MSKARPRILFKRDDESSIGRGAIIHGAHFRPEIAKIVWSAASAAGTWGWSELWITEGWRPSTGRRDLHSELRALDFSCRQIEGDDQQRLKTAEAWARQVFSLLGPDYQVIAHGEGANLHLHVELDP